MDGDAKINMSEFAMGMKSSLTAFAKVKGKRPKSSVMSGYATKLVTTNSASQVGANNYPIR